MVWADLTDARLHFELGGRGAPLLLIPGLGSTCRVWDPVVPALQDKFHTIAVDNRGAGLSEAKRQPRTLHDFSADLLELLDHLQVERTHVMGISLGGIIAQRFAVDHPQRVGRLVLMSCTHRFGPYLWEMARLVGLTLRRFSMQQYVRTLELLGSGPFFVDADPQRLDRVAADFSQRHVSRATIVRQLHCLMASDIEPAGYRIEAPTLVVAGEHDVLIPCCYARRMAEAIPGSTFLLVPEAGHNPVAERPDHVLPAISCFVAHGRLTGPVPRDRGVRSDAAA